MKPAPFDYVRVETGVEAAEILGEEGESARILAGGQSLMAVLNMRFAQPALLVDISRSDSLAYVRVSGGQLAVGAAATMASVEWRAALRREVPLLSEVFPCVAHFQIRNRGTVCGSIAHADPSAELPLVLVALGGEVLLRSSRGTRAVAADEFFQGMLRTACAADEIVEEARFPLARPGCGYAFEEFSLRHGDFAIVALAAMVDSDHISLAVGGVGDRPVHRRWPLEHGEALDDAINDFAWELDAASDAQASAPFRRHLVRNLAPRVIARAEACRS